MNPKVRRLLTLPLSALVCLAALPSLAQEPIRVVQQGKPLDLDVPPVIVEGRVLVPLRKIFEALGAVVNYEETTGRIVAVRGASRVELAIGSTEALVNGQRVYLSVPARIVDGRTMVPVRFVSEALGDQVDWDDATRTVTVNRRQVSLDFETALMGPSDLPFLGFTVLESDFGKGRQRYFVQGSWQSAGGPLMAVGMAPIAGDPANAVETTPCPPGETEFLRPKLGDAARACYRNRNGGTEMTLTVAWRGRVIMVTIYDLEADKDFTFALALMLANQQMEILNRLAEGAARPAPPQLPALVEKQLAERMQETPAAGETRGEPVAAEEVQAERVEVARARLQLLEQPVTPAKFSFAPAGALPVATSGEVYSASLCSPAVDEASDLCGWPRAANPLGGRPPYQFYSEFSFPSIGLNLLNNGLITGRPSAAAGGKIYPIRVCAKDLTGAASCQDMQLTVALPAAPFQFAHPDPLPPARVGQAYRYVFCTPEPAAGGDCGEGQATTMPTGGIPPYTFRVESGVLPAGLALSASGVLGGTPSAGIYANDLSICAADAAMTEICRKLRLYINQNTQAPLMQNSTWKATFTVQDRTTKTHSGSFTFRVGPAEVDRSSLALTDVTLSFHDPHDVQRASLFCSVDRPNCTGFDVTFRSPSGAPANLGFQFRADQDYLAKGTISPTTIQGTAFYMGRIAGIFTATRQD